MRLGHNTPQKGFRSESQKAPLRFDEFSGAKPFGTFRGHNESTPRLENIERTNHALDGLVVRFIQRISRRARYNRMELSIDGDFCVFSCEFDGGKMTGYDLAKVYKRKSPLLINHGVDGVSPLKHLHDRKLLLV